MVGEGFLFVRPVYAGELSQSGGGGTARTHKVDDNYGQSYNNEDTFKRITAPNHA